MGRCWRDHNRRAAAGCARKILAAASIECSSVTPSFTDCLISNRKHCPFVAVNCGAIDRELTESELFGNVKGAFTGATRSHAGFFERSEGGTLFLDEVTEMPTELQVKLLRVLEAEQIHPVGSEQDYPVDVRIIASTNRDSEEAVACGILRQDLYYRLAQFPIRRMIFATLEHFEGDKKATANALGVSLKTLYNRIKYYRVYTRSE